MQEWPDGFDLAAVLAPISDEAAAGTDLRQDASPESLYFRLRDARADARTAERASEAGGDAGAVAQWRPVRELALEALSRQTKDLEIAAWLTEALLRNDGLQGLAAGFHAMAGICETFWDEFFPQPDEEGIAGRLASVAGLNGTGRDGTLIQPLRRVVLFARPDGAPFEFWQFEQSREVAGIGDDARRQQRFDAGVVPFETVESEARAAGAAVFDKLREAAEEAQQAWQSLAQILDARAGADAPPTSQVRDLLGQIREVAERFAAPHDTAPQMATVEPGEAAAGVGDTSRRIAGAVATREDALRALGEIAEFFRRTEPHSPLAYTLQEAVRRGRMSWPDLLAEIVPDAASRSAILSALGIRPPPE